MNQANGSLKKILRSIPKTSYIFLGLALLSTAILLTARLSPSFAIFFDKYISRNVRALLAFISNPLPFSAAEALIILSPVIITLVIVYAIKKRSASVCSFLSFFVTLISRFSLVFTLFVFSFGVEYHTPPIYERLEINNDSVTADELKKTASILVSEINNRVNGINFSSNGASKLPYSLSEMSDILVSSANALNQKYGFVQSLKSRVKPVFFSVPLSYLHTTGIYSFFTGESNLNVDFPDYTLPYTAAHELAHQRGIARENEANFIAFLVCLNSEDEYIKYCSYLNMFEYVATALYNENPTAYYEIFTLLSAKAKGELSAYSTFYDKYRNSEASQISTSLNDAYLKANGTKEGTKSYGLVVELAVSYIMGNFDD